MILINIISLFKYLVPPQNISLLAIIRECDLSCDSIKY